MMYQLISQEVTNQDYLIQYSSSPSPSTSLEQIDTVDILDYILSILMRKPLKKLPLHTLIPLLETDISSIWSNLDIKTETLSIEAAPEEVFSMEMLEHDIVVQIPAKRRYRLEIEVKNIRKGRPVPVDIPPFK